MIERWLMDYWWILAALLYVILLIVVMRVLARRGTFDTVWPRITLAVTCVLIILIPTMHSPLSYVVAVGSVFNLLVLFKGMFKSESSSEPVER
jgi:hypothetical protein